MITLRTPDGDKSPATLTLQTASGQEGVARMVLRTPTGDETIYSVGGMVLTLTPTPLSVTGSGSSDGDLTLVTAQVTVSVSGGTPPYTHAWTFVSGDTGWVILSPSSASTRFQNDVPTLDGKSGTFRDTVTDARGRTGTVDVTAQLFNFGSLGGL